MTFEPKPKTLERVFTFEIELPIAAGRLAQNVIDLMENTKIKVHRAG